MSIDLRWVGEEDYDRVAQTRMRCFAHAASELERFRETVRLDPRVEPGDVLLAEQNGQGVGTSAVLPLTMWVRGGEVACQGVSWVGTIKTHRRRCAGGDGIATRIMRETLRRGRERQQVVSALMPFRASFYEHFGYGLVERRNEWTLPLSALPSGPTESMRFCIPHDIPELVQLRKRMAGRGQCDIERAAKVWEFLIKRAEAGFFMVDQPRAGGPIRGFIWIERTQAGTKDHLHVMDNGYDSVVELKRQLHFLASLRDQYAAAIITLPTDLPLHWLLRETQIPHRPVNHAAADLRQFTRMQLRVLDHKRLLEAMHLPPDRRGRAAVAVQECDGETSQFAVDISDGRAIVTSTSDAPQFVCPDRVWAAVVCGELLGTRAAELGMASCRDAGAARLLDIFSAGPAPFCREYF